MIFYTHALYSQRFQGNTEGYTVNSSYDDLLNAIIKASKSQPVVAEAISNLYLRKAKKDTINIKIARGYHFLSSFYREDLEKSLKFLDSSLMYYKKKGRHGYYPAITFLNKGVILEEQSKVMEATKYHLLSAEFAIAVGNEQLTYYAKHNIATLKKRVKKFSEAERLFQEAIDFEKSKRKLTYEDSLSLLLSSAELIDVLRLNNKLIEADSLNIVYLSLFEDFEEKFLFTINKIGILAGKQNHEEVIELFRVNKNLLKELEIKDDYDRRFNFISIYYSLSKSYKSLGDDQNYLRALLKIDSLYQNTGYLDYRIKDVFGQFISYYKKLKKSEEELIYIDRFLDIDSLITKNFHSIDEQIIENFDRPILQAEKESIILNLENKASKRGAQMIVVFVIAIGLSFLSLYFFRRNVIFKKRLEQLLNDNTKKNHHALIKERDSSNSKRPEMPLSTFNDLLEKLQNFEKSKGYLNRNVNITSLAKMFNSNTKYLSSVVNYEKGMNFSRYINDLRLEYFIDKSQVDENFHRYTIKAVAVECGFNSTEVFSKSFYKKTKIYPSFFLKNINNLKQ